MPTFNTIWRNFPEKEELEKKCFNEQSNSSEPFSDYCAILLSEALIKSGISVAGSRGNKCWSHDGDKHVLLAEDLARWLNRSPKPSTIGKREDIKPIIFQKKLKGRTGIVFFKDYWGQR